MKKIWFVGSLMAVSSLSAQAAGIEATNAEIGGAYVYADGETVDSNGFVVDGRLGLPLGEAFGLNITSTYSEISPNGVSDVTAELKDVGGELVWRHRDQLRLGAGYEYREVDLERGSLNTEETSDIVSASADFYIDQADLGVAYSNTENGAFEEVDLSASWYLDDNLRAGVELGLADAETVALELETQPAIFDNNVSIGLRAERDTEDDVNFYGVRVAYAFGTNVDLKERIRKYR